MKRLNFFGNFVAAALRVVAAASSADVIDGNSNSTNQMTGKTLKDIGIKLNKPLLQLLGDTIIHVEKKIQETACVLQSCSVWSEWSSCIPLHLKGFGYKQRNRTCAREKGSCYFKTNSTVETASEICLTRCPSHYSLTKNGYCLHLYNKTFVVQSDAENHCSDDGGHIVNIDSERKYDDVAALLLEKKFTNGIWINGQRKDSSSPWEYLYGSSAGFFKWYSGYPHNGATDLCLVIAMYGSNLRWHDLACSSKYAYICEVI